MYRCSHLVNSIFLSLHKVCPFNRKHFFLLHNLYVTCVLGKIFDEFFAPEHPSDVASNFRRLVIFFTSKFLLILHFHWWPMRTVNSAETGVPAMAAGIEKFFFPNRKLIMREKIQFSTHILPFI